MSLVKVNTSVASCVDQYEAHCYQVFDNGTEVLWPFNHPVDGITVRAEVSPSVIPQAYISADQGAAACKLAGKRLCRLGEWLAGCRGPQGYTFPYGNTYVPGYCNTGRPLNPVIELFGKNATFDNVEMNDPRLDLLPNTLSSSGNFSKCVQPDYGIYDISGNLDEWVADVTSIGHGVFKGGYFVDAIINGPGCLYTTTAHSPAYHDYSLGFRCCADPR
eukprot:TRINITY_DN12813_c0_g1_i1.p1 TRINITY_DN12813_c0_g1~~TRINITY_DN12813_c0_g1_i1.p1  ORF type:complete len:246 (+),score=0.57 TRINITY_DN12813_c0_g1_i1:87-740(+)